MMPAPVSARVTAAAAARNGLRRRESMPSHSGASFLFTHGWTMGRGVAGRSGDCHVVYCGLRDARRGRAHSHPEGRTREADAAWRCSM